MFAGSFVYTLLVNEGLSLKALTANGKSRIYWVR